MNIMCFEQCYFSVHLPQNHNFYIPSGWLWIVCYILHFCIHVHFQKNIFNSAYYQKYLLIKPNTDSQFTPVQLA